MIDFILGTIVVISIFLVLFGSIFAIAADRNNLRIQGEIASILAISFGYWYFFW